jgi:HAD superfamily hydrolase (TIGR01459 family)
MHAAPPHPTPPLIAGLAALADRYDVVLSDIWGVLHDGVWHFPPAAEALRRFRAGGGTVILVTNAPRPRQPILAQLQQLGVPDATFDGLVTSGDVTLTLMAEHGNAPLNHIGPPRDLSLLEGLRAEYGLVPPLVELAAASYVLCTGLDEEANEALDPYEPALEATVRRGLTMICANPDRVVHSGERLIYCAGALAQRLEELGGRAIYAGKPHPPIYRRALAEAARLSGRPVDAARVLAIGDAFATDIVGAAGQGLDALFVTHGIHRDRLYDSSGALVPAAYAELAGGSLVRPIAAIERLVW